MKKSILAVAVILGSTATFAQEEKVYLPESGDWAISVDATPFLNYFGNFIGGNGLNVAPTWNFLVGDQRIVGKYFVDESTAYRAGIRLGFGAEKGSWMVDDRSDNNNTTPPNNWPEPNPEVENTWKMGTTNIGLSGGLEMRRGNGRLQGFYGGELGILLSSTKDTYTYGNTITASVNGGDAGNVDITAADDATGVIGGQNTFTEADGQGFGQNGRVLESKSGMTFGLGLRGFIGAEYFILPKFAIGGEFGWGLTFMSTGASSTQVEVEGYTGTATPGTDPTTVATRTDEGTKTSEFGFDTDNMNSVFGPVGSLRLTFHF